jgi:hypothetical protein
MRCWVSAVGAVGPGFAEWAQLARVLRGQAAYAPVETRLPKLDMLPPVERRRTGVPVKLALAAGAQALAAAGVAADRVASVFTSSGGDGAVLHDICTMLASGDHQISPTKFHNSVHNAPSGYWSIATQCRQASTSLCGYDWSFAAGLLEAVAQTALDHEHVLLVSYDEPYPEPLNATREIRGALGVALLLTRERAPGSPGRLALALSPQAQRPPNRLAEPGLEALRTGNPTGRSLPLLSALALGAGETVQLDYLPGGSLSVAVSPA